MARRLYTILSILTAFLFSDLLQTHVSADPPKEITAKLPGGATMEFVYIKPGEFVMGSPESEPNRWKREDPQHKVRISKGFHLGKYEMTQRQWERVMGTAPWVGVTNYDGGPPYVDVNPDNPAVYVSWDDAQVFIKKLNDAEGSEMYRLPTEAEWEYACRAGTTTRWSFGDDESLLKDYAWYKANAWDVNERYAHAVGLKKPNPWGLYDMHGNVFEWCWDWLGEYPGGPQVDPTGPSTGRSRSRVLRGGGFDYHADRARSAFRFDLGPDNRCHFLGFRLLRRVK
jgi:formylglycine-generating enzyme required for sulfatase activity